MSEEKMLEMESEKQEITEFIKLFKEMPKDSRKDIKLLMMYANFASGKNGGEEKKRA